MAPRIPVLPTPLCWLPALVVAGLIWYWSLVTTPPTDLPLQSSYSSAQLLTSGFQPTDFEFSSSHQRHGIAYATLALTLGYGFVNDDRPLIQKAILIVVVATSYGILMEAGQAFHPDRTASVVDIVVNAVGAVLGLSWYVLEPRVQFEPVLESTYFERSLDEA